MTQEDKELLLKDLCARLPYGVICHANKINIDGELIFVNRLYSIAALYYDNATGKFESCPINDIKPYLRPMSSMTKEEKEEWGKTFEAVYDYAPDENEDDDNIVGWHAEPGIESCDYLHAHHFDYRGLIEKGLALEAPEGMYNI